MFPVLASACLCGIACRYDGMAASHPVVADLFARGLAVPVCPEVLGGLPVPRFPCELRDGRVMDAHGRDLTEAFAAGAAATLALARERNITVAVLKERSPSCGSGHIYDGAFAGRLIPGQGVAAALLRANGVTVYNEEAAAELGAMARRA